MNAMTLAWKSRFLYIRAFFAGMLLATAFAKLEWAWAGWLAPGLMLGDRTFRKGYVAGLGFYLTVLYWTLLIPFPLQGLMGWVALSAILSCYIGLWCWFCGRIKPVCGRWVWPVLCAAAWAAMEMVMARLFTGWGWTMLGETQYRFLALTQIASVAGVYGVAFLLVWFSVSLVEVVRGHFILLIAPVVGIGVVIVFGSIRLSAPQAERGKIRIALVQPSIPQRTIWDANEKTNRFLKLVELSRQALKAEPDLLVWPEASMPDLFRRTAFMQQTIVSLLKTRPVWMAIGANDTAPKANAPNEIEGYNSAFLINPKGEIVARYNKRHLVPCGEYMPWAREFPFLSHLRRSGAGLTPGRQIVQFNVDKPAAKFLPLICFEDVFSQDARPGVDEDTDFILNLTNDGWFGESAEQWQHAISGLFRAIENGVPLVRCANNGLTCWIDSRGRIHEMYFPGSKNIYQEGVKIVEVPLQAAGRTNTFYRRYGDWFGWSCVAVCGLVTLRQRMRKKLGDEGISTVTRRRLMK